MGSIDFDFDGQTVVVTGGSSGLGRAISLRFAEAGATVVNGDITTEAADKDADLPTHERIEADGGTAAYVETDVTDPDQIATLVEAAREFGGVDVMVNNAGTGSTQSLLEVDPDSFMDLMALNGAGVLFGCQAAAKDMLDRDEPGAIVNMASIRSNFAHWNQIAYGATKGAVRMITRYSAFELAEHGIRVNGIAPGPIATDGRESTDAQEIRDKVASGGYNKDIPLGRAGEPHEVAPPVLYLASDDASYTTGEIVHVDGGYQIY